MPNWKPSQIPPIVTPDELHTITNIGLARIQERIAEGVTPVNHTGAMTRAAALALVQALTREDAEKSRQATRAERSASPTPKAKAPPLATAAKELETSQRMATVCDMLAQMHPAREIRETLAARWQVTPATVETYIALAYQDLARLGQLGKTARKDQLRDAFAEFFAAARDAGDFKTAAIALDRLAKIEGAYEPEKIEVGGSFGDTLNNPNNIRDRISKLLENPELLNKLQDLTK